VVVLVAGAAASSATIGTTLLSFTGREQAAPLLTQLTTRTCTVGNAGQATLLVSWLACTVSTAGITIRWAVPAGFLAVAAVVTAPGDVDAGALLASVMSRALSANVAAAIIPAFLAIAH